MNNGGLLYPELASISYCPVFFMAPRMSQSTIPSQQIGTTICSGGQQMPRRKNTLTTGLENSKFDGKLHQAELSTFATGEVLEALIQFSPLAIMALNTEGKVILWNPAAEQCFGWTAREVIGYANPVVPETRKPEYEAMSRQVLDGTPMLNVETVRKRKDGSLIDVSISSSPLRDASGRYIGRMAIIMEITDRKKIENLVPCLGT
jgi:PAS domain S-box-containing protein